MDRQKSEAGRIGVVLVAAWGIVSLFVHVFLVTHGTFTVIAPEHYSKVFDSLAANLLVASAEVERSSAMSEHFIVNGKLSVYNGLFPAILRIPLTALFPGYSYKWARLSCLLASFLACWAWAVLIHGMVSPTPARGERLRFLILLFAFSLGTPLVFLISCAYMYHESAIWGLSAAMWGLYFARAILDGRGDSRMFLGLSSSAAAALLSRLTFGVPLYGAALLLAANTCLRLRKEGRSLLPVLVSVGAPLLLGACVQGWYNYARFDSVITFAPHEAYRADIPNVDILHQVFRTYGTFETARLPDALRNYLGYRPPAVMDHPPYLKPGVAEYVRPEISMASISPYREWVVSLSLCSSWLLAGAVVGGLRLRGTVSWGIMLLFLAQALVLLGYPWITHRYTADLLPLLLFLFLAAAPWYLKGAARPRLQLAVTCVSAALVVTSIAVSVLTAVGWNVEQNWGNSDEDREALKRALTRLLP